jgi:hypothetical protein
LIGLKEEESLFPINVLFVGLTVNDKRRSDEEACLERSGKAQDDIKR